MNKTVIENALLAGRKAWAIFEHYTDEQILSEMDYARKMTLFRLDQKSIQQYVRTPRTGRSFKIQGARQGKELFYFAMAYTEHQRLAEIQGSHARAKGNASLARIEEKCFHGADEANA